MPRIAAFEVHHRRYVARFVEHEAACISELLALRRFVPKEGRGVEIGVGTGRFATPLPLRMAGPLLRSFHRVLKVARTIADLARSGLLKSLHVAEALAYRSADRGANRLHEVQPGLTSDLRSPRPLSPQRLWARRSLPEPMNAIDV